VPRHRLVALLAAIAVLAVLLTAGATVILLRTAHSSGDFHRHLAAHFKPRPDCPVPDPFVETNVDYDCFDGTLPSGHAIELVLGQEPGSRAIVWSYIGVFVPDASAATLAPFVDRVRARGDWWGRRQGGAPTAHILVPPPETEPVRAEPAEGGAFIAWRLQTLPTVAKLQARLVEIDAALGRR
jgi:hypothetical protein